MAWKGSFWWLTANETWSYGCQSKVMKIFEKAGFKLNWLMTGNISCDPVTPNGPPSQKSFWGSTMIKAVDMYLIKNMKYDEINNDIDLRRIIFSDGLNSEMEID